MIAPTWTQLDDAVAKNYKKLSYRWGTARRAVLVETVRNVAQMFVDLHLVGLRPAKGEGPSRSLEMARIDKTTDTFPDTLAER